MIKYLCDICGKEMQNTEDHARMFMQEQKISFIKHKAHPELIRTEYLFCKEHAGKVRDYAMKLAKECQQTENK